MYPHAVMLLMQSWPVCGYGTNYVGHNYVGHNYVGHNYQALKEDHALVIVLVGGTEGALTADAADPLLSAFAAAADAQVPPSLNRLVQSAD